MGEEIALESYALVHNILVTYSNNDTSLKILGLQP